MPRRPAITSEVSYRWATTADVLAVLDLWKAAGSHGTITDTFGALDSLIAHDSTALLVAQSAGQIIGSLIAGWNGWRGSLYRLAVHPDHQRRGIATELVRRAIEQLHARGAQRIDAFVVAADASAVAFWDGLAAMGMHRDEPKLRFVVERNGGSAFPRH